MDLNLICSRLGIDPLKSGLQMMSAEDMARDFFPRLDTDRPAIVGPLCSAALARQVRRTLLVNYPADHPVIVLQGEAPSERTLGGLTRGKFGPETVLFIPPLPEPGSPVTLACLVARLQAPGGCPWDRKQTHRSLRRALLEETYEVIEALDEEDPVKLREELGDLLLHVLFQTNIARRQDEFSLAEVGEELAAKLIRRHPHVFGETEVANAEEVVTNWERIKQEEKKAAGRAEAKPGLDANIPHALPALPRAQKVIERAKRKGIAPDDGLGREVRGQLGRGKNRERALGDMLLALAAYAEENDMDASTALRAATSRFVRKADRPPAKRAAKKR